jgi:hypothetical protein
VNREEVEGLGGVEEEGEGIGGCRGRETLNPELSSVGWESSENCGEGERQQEKEARLRSQWSSGT